MSNSVITPTYIFKATSICKNNSPVPKEITKSVIYTSHAEFSTEVTAAVSEIEERYTPGFGGRIAILEDVQNIHFQRLNNKIAANQSILQLNLDKKWEALKSEMDMAEKNIGLIEDNAKGKGIRLSTEYMILFTQVRGINAFLRKDIVSCSSGQPKVSLLELTMEVQRIEKMLPPKRVQKMDVTTSAITVGVRSATDDINPFLADMPGVAGDHGLVSGCAAAVFDIVGTMLAQTIPLSRKIDDKINKFRLLLKLESYLSSGKVVPLGLDLRINAILKKKRSMNLFQTATSFTLKKKLVKNHVPTQININSDALITKEEEFIKSLISFEDKLANFSQMNEDIEGLSGSLNSLLESVKNDFNRDEISKLEQNIKSHLSLAKNDSFSIYDYIWQILNNSNHFRATEAHESLRKVYYTPLESIQRHSTLPGEIYKKLKQSLSMLVVNLSGVKALDIDSLNPSSNFSDSLYDYLFSLLESAEKDNVVNVMHQVILIIDSSVSLKQSEKSSLYNRLLEFRLNPDHGNLFKVANSSRIEALMKKGTFDFLRYSGHNISTVNIVTASNPLYTNLVRWEWFHTLSVISRSRFYRTYIERSHTVNTICQLHEFALEKFKCHSEKGVKQDSHSASQNADITIAMGGKTNSVKITNKHQYNELITLQEYDNKILPALYHKVLANNSKMEVLEKRKIVLNFSDFALQNDKNFQQALLKPSSNNERFDKSCSVVEFEHVACLAFQLSNNPLIALGWLSGFAAGDSNPDREWAKLGILSNILASSDDRRSVLYGKFAPSAAKTFMVEMLVSSLLSTGYGAAYALMPPAAFPGLLCINWLRICGSDSITIDWLLRKINKPNREVAAAHLLELMDNSQSKNVDSGNQGNEDRSKQWRKFNLDLSNRVLEKYSPNRDENNLGDSARYIRSKLVEEARQITNRVLTQENQSAADLIERLSNEMYLSENTTQEQLLHKLLLLSYITQQIIDNNSQLTSGAKISLLVSLLYLLRFGLLAPGLRKENVSVAETFFDTRNLIATASSLAPYACSTFITNELAGKILGLVFDVAGSIACSLGISQEKGFTKSYAVIMKIFKNQLLQLAIDLKQNDQLSDNEIFLVYGVLGTHRSRVCMGETLSQTSFRRTIKINHNKESKF